MKRNLFAVVLAGLMFSAAAPCQASDAIPFENCLKASAILVPGFLAYTAGAVTGCAFLENSLDKRCKGKCCVISGVAGVSALILSGAVLIKTMSLAVEAIQS
jgi:hypothetical protein